MRTRWLSWLGTAGLLLAVPACVVHDTRPVNTGYGYASATGYATASVTVGEPAPAEVASLPPEPLYEQMTASPGLGHVWIDGSWHWNGYEWVWVSGRWVREQGAAYVYVQPSYDYAGGGYVYTPGHWASRERVPQGWSVRDHRDGRPAVVEPPPGAVRPPPSSSIGRPMPPTVRDHRAPAAGAYDRRPAEPPPTVRDHRQPAPRRR